MHFKDKWPKHSRECCLVKFYHAFIFYLHLLVEGNSKTSKSSSFNSCPLAINKDKEDVEVEFDPKKKQTHVSKEIFDAILTLVSLANAALSCKQEILIEEFVYLNFIPSFSMVGDIYYILLTYVYTR